MRRNVMNNHIHPEYKYIEDSFELPHLKNTPKSNTSTNSIDPHAKYDNSLKLDNKIIMSKSDIARKAAATRKSHDPDAFKKMGSKGGKAKHKHKEEVE